MISDAVVSSLRSYATSGTVTRLAGADRYATAIAVSKATDRDGRPAHGVHRDRRHVRGWALGDAGRRQGERPAADRSERIADRRGRG